MTCRAQVRCGQSLIHRVVSISYGEECEFKKEDGRKSEIWIHPRMFKESSIGSAAFFLNILYATCLLLRRNENKMTKFHTFFGPESGA